MNFKQKPLDQQVIVITGATSGIGLATSRLAARGGARLMLIARNEKTLEQLADEVNTAGGRAEYAAVDVVRESELERASRQVIEAFGTFDTWVNNAGVSIYGNLEDVPEEDSRRLFDTNFWGLVNGSLIAVKHFRKKGGTLINVGSTLSDRAIPLQGMYCASKHAVKGFTDSLRMELESRNAPVIVSLVKPSAIDTPYPDHARNYLDVEPQNPAPVYSPDTVAETILHCAENPVRDVFVGGGGKLLSVAGKMAPRLTDYYMEKAMISGQKTDRRPNGRGLESLYDSNEFQLRERGDYDGHVARSSLYTKASLHPLATGALIGFGVGAAFLLGKNLVPARAGEHNKEH